MKVPLSSSTSIRGSRLNPPKRAKDNPYDKVPKCAFDTFESCKSKGFLVGWGGGVVTEHPVA